MSDHHAPAPDAGVDTAVDAAAESAVDDVATEAPVVVDGPPRLNDYEKMILGIGVALLGAGFIGLLVMQAQIDDPSVSLAEDSLAFGYLVSWTGIGAGLLALLAYLCVRAVVFAVYAAVRR